MYFKFLRNILVAVLFAVSTSLCHAALVGDHYSIKFYDTADNLKFAGEFTLGAQSGASTFAISEFVLEGVSNTTDTIRWTLPTFLDETHGIWPNKLIGAVMRSNWGDLLFTFNSKAGYNGGWNRTLFSPNEFSTGYYKLEPASASVPEPDSALIAGLGMLMLVIAARRKLLNRA